MQTTGRLARVFIWLSGASEEGLANCPAWERRKYVAFGATVLVPCLFAFMASAYAVGTLTDNRSVIGFVSVVWSFIILTIDRALLATYRSYQSNFRKIGQFSLRIFVATLMGLTISHPLTLLLFKDTLASVIEKDREAEMAMVQAKALEKKKALEDKIAALNEKTLELQGQWSATFQAGLSTDEETEVSSGLDQAVTEAQGRTLGKLAEVEKEIASLTEQSAKLQEELTYWQKEFERELNGQRSGLAGLGPRAKSIQDDQLVGRRAESKRLAGLLEAKTKERNQLQGETAAIEREVTGQYRSEKERLDDLNRLIQEQQLGQFVEHQNQSRAAFKTQIDAALEQMQQAQGDLAKLGQDERTRLEALGNEPRRDLLRQTLALNHLFQDAKGGGRFALTTYVVLCLLFLLVDTIPLVLKFFSKPGPYDTLVDRDEVHFERERDAFLKNPIHSLDNPPKETVRRIF